MRFSSLALAAALAAAPVAWAAPMVGSCPGNDETFGFYYQFCVNSTHVSEVEGTCHGNGTKTQMEEISSCSDWADVGENVTNCVMCGDRPVCTNDSSNQALCTAANSKTCNSGLNWEVDSFPCVSSSSFEYIIDSCVDGVLSERKLIENCVADNPMTPYCRECSGVGICAEVDDTCVRIQEGPPEDSIIKCPGGGETFTYLHQYCVNKTHVGRVEATCHGNGTKTQLSNNAVTCPEWASVGGNVTDCVQCFDSPVCTNNSTDQARVCVGSIIKACNSGLNWEKDELSCVNAAQYEYNVNSCVDGVFSTSKVDSGNCSVDAGPATPHCENCTGVNLVCTGQDGVCPSSITSGGVKTHANSFVGFVGFVGILTAVLLAE